MVNIENKSATLPPRTSETTVGDDGVSHNCAKLSLSLFDVTSKLKPLTCPNLNADNNKLEYTSFTNKG
jgi:hypothetical protein